MCARALPSIAGAHQQLRQRTPTARTLLLICGDDTTATRNPPTHSHKPALCNCCRHKHHPQEFPVAAPQQQAQQHSSRSARRLRPREAHRVPGCAAASQRITQQQGAVVLLVRLPHEHHLVQVQQQQNPAATPQQQQVPVAAPRNQHYHRLVSGGNNFSVSPQSPRSWG